MARAKETPYGIKKLIATNGVFVKQKNTTGFVNKYAVTTPDGDFLFKVKEVSSAMSAMLGGSKRGFDMDMYDVNDEMVISLRRPYTIGVSKLEVSVCGTLASVVRQEATFMKPVLRINDAHDNPVLRVKGPVSTTGECDFELQTADKHRIGSITKEWGGLREMFTHADQFSITFPQDLDVRYKAAVIGTCLLIDFLYYERS